MFRYQLYVFGSPSSETCAVGTDSNSLAGCSLCPVVLPNNPLCENGDILAFSHNFVGLRKIKPLHQALRETTYDRGSEGLGRQTDGTGLPRGVSDLHAT